MDNKQSEVRKPIKTSMLKCGKRTFFFDVYLASNNEQSSRYRTKKYLKITESRFVSDGQERKRNTMLLFPEDAINFQGRLNEIVLHLA